MRSRYLTATLGVWVAAILVAGVAAIAAQNPGAPVAAPQLQTTTTADLGELSADGVPMRGGCDTTELGWERCFTNYLLEAARVDGVNAALVDLEVLMGASDLYVGMCHPLTHGLGQNAYSIVGDIHDGIAEGTPVCEFGYYHGLFEGWGAEASRAEIAAALPTLCEEVIDDGTFLVDKCSHGVGHAAWPAAESNLEAALELCDLLPEPQRIGCGGGVTMSMVQSPTYDELRSTADVVAICDRFGDYRGSCIVESGPMMLRVTAYDIAAAYDGCLLLNEADRKPCTLQIGMEVSGQVNYDPDDTIASCVEVSNGYVANCLEGAVYQMLARTSPTGRAAAETMCAKAPEDFAVRCAEMLKSEPGML